jgi:hypothetical protein
MWDNVLLIFFLYFPLDYSKMPQQINTTIAYKLISQLVNLHTYFFRFSPFSLHLKFFVSLTTSYFHEGKKILFSQALWFPLATGHS